MRSWVLGYRHDIYCLTTQMAFHRKLHFAIGLREQRVIAATANILTRMELSASLTNDDVPRKNLLTAKFFYTQSFGL